MVMGAIQTSRQFADSQRCRFFLSFHLLGQVSVVVIYRVVRVGQNSTMTGNKLRRTLDLESRARQRVGVLGRVTW